jgi:hypothetical protein
MDRVMTGHGIILPPSNRWELAGAMGLVGKAVRAIEVHG